MIGNGGRVVGSSWMRVAACACALLLAGALGGCTLTTPSLDEVQRESVDPVVSAPAIMEDGTLTVAVNTSDAPQAMNGTDGTPSGYYVDVASALAQRMGLKIKIVSSASAEKALNGKADIYIGASVSDTSDDMTVIGSVGEDASAIFAKGEGSQGTSSITVEDMANGVVAVQDASASQDALVRAGIKAAQQTYANVNECFEALDVGEVDYVACDATAGAYLSRAYQGISFAGIVGKASTFGIAVSSGGELSSAVSDALDALVQDGTLDTVRVAWYGDLPMELSDTELEGVTISSTEDDSSSDAESTEPQGDAESSADDTSDGGIAIAGDINSLSD